MGKLVQLWKGTDKAYPYPGFPVGAIYMSMNNTNPSTYFGGTWSLIAPGRVLVGVDSSQSEFNTVRKSGGAKTHQLTTAEMPSHAHSQLNANASGSDSGWNYVPNVGASNKGFNNMGTNPTGGGQAHNNLQPYLTCYIWERTS